jgi:hypothetical protein
MSGGRPWGGVTLGSPPTHCKHNPQREGLKYHLARRPADAKCFSSLVVWGVGL